MHTNWRKAFHGRNNNNKKSKSTWVPSRVVELPSFSGSGGYDACMHLYYYCVYGTVRCAYVCVSLCVYVYHAFYIIRFWSFARTQSFHFGFAQTTSVCTQLFCALYLFFFIHFFLILNKALGEQHQKQRSQNMQAILLLRICTVYIVHTDAPSFYYIY